MTPYTTDQFNKDRERILSALDALDALRQKYGDVIAIPEIVTLHDITEYRVDTQRGPRVFDTMYDRNTAVAVLNYFKGNDYITPEVFESTIVCALQQHLKEKDLRG
jgi:hypothetical protein